MSEQTSQEPTMEEILASIRRIISEDDAPASEDAAPGDPPKVEAAPEPVEAAVIETAPLAAEPEPAVEEDDEVLELTERLESHGDIEVYTPAAAPPPPEPEPVAAAPPAEDFALDVEPAPRPTVEASLVGAATATAAASAFGALSAAISMPKEGRSLEDVVRELLRPLLKDWLDQNLANIVQAAVAEEVDRIARIRSL